MSVRRGFSYLETLVAVLLLAVAATTAVSSWNVAARAPANKRVAEIALGLAASHMEMGKARLTLGLPAGQAALAPDVFYGQSGEPAVTATPSGYRVRSSVRVVSDSDGIPSTDDLCELTVEVWDGSGQVLYETSRTLLAFGGR